MTPDAFDDALLGASTSTRRGALAVLVAALGGGLPRQSDARQRLRDGKDRKDGTKRRDRKRRKDKKKKSGKKKQGKCKSHYSEQQILGFIKKSAKQYGQSRKAMERVARCESNLDPCAVNRSGPYYGLYQFLKSTWKTTPYKNDNIFDPKAQALATGWMWKQGRKNEWACK